MTLTQLMERLGTRDSGRVVRYLEEAIEDLNMNYETNIKLLD